MQFGLRDSKIVKAYERWQKKIPSTYTENIQGLEQEGDSLRNHQLATLKHYRSLAPMAMEARKPIFDLKAADGALGAHAYAVKSCHDDFQALANAILKRIEIMETCQELLF